MTDRPEPGTPLSRREHEVISHMAKGLDYGQVGACLGIKASTVGCIAMRAMARTRTESIFQLGMWAQRNGYSPTGAPVFVNDRCDCGRRSCDGISCPFEATA